VRGWYLSRVGLFPLGRSIRGQVIVGSLRQELSIDLLECQIVQNLNNFFPRFGILFYLKIIKRMVTMKLLLYSWKITTLFYSLFRSPLN